MAKKATTTENLTGGINLVLEKDSGNPVTIATGNKENSLKFWEHLSELCEGAINSLKND